MKHVLPLLFSLFSFSGFAQTHLASVDVSASLHGSGDLLGPAVNIEYGRYASKRLAWSGNVTATIHSGAETVLWINDRTTEDYAYRKVTAGLQVGGQLWVLPLRTAHHELRLGAGPLFRYQSSNYSGYSFRLLPPALEPAFTFYNREPQHLFSPGYQVALVYGITLGRGLLLGLRAGFQNDTEGSIITYTGLRVGKRF